MKMRMIFLAATVSLAAYAQAAPVYQKMSDACKVCKLIDRTLTRHSEATDRADKMQFVTALYKEIQTIKLKGKSQEEQRREIYFALNASVEMLEDDFESSTVTALMDVRAQSPENFDYVLWRFPLVTQKQIIQRMQASKTDKIRPKASIPVAKEIDPQS